MSIRISWLGHLERMEEERMLKKIFTQEQEGTRRRGRPRKRWKEEVERDLRVLGVRRWRELVADRKKMEGHCSTGQSPQWAVVPMEEECICQINSTLWSRVLLEKLTGSQPVKKFPRNLRNPKVYYGIYNSPAPVPILSQTNPVQTPSHFLKMRFNIIFPSIPGSSKWALSVSFPHQNPVCTSSHPHTCYMFHPSHSS